MFKKIINYIIYKLNSRINYFKKQESIIQYKLSNKYYLISKPFKFNDSIEKINIMINNLNSFKICNNQINNYLKV